LLAALIMVLMTTWMRGRKLLLSTMRADDPPLLPFLQGLLQSQPPQAARTAVFLTADPETVPHALLHNLKHNNVLHRTNVILTVVFHEVPWVAQPERVQVQQLSPLFWRVRVNYGFRDVPDVPQALGSCTAHGLDINLFETSYFVSRETLVAPGNGMAPWRERLFATLSRNAGSVVDFFRIPVHNVIELGTRIQL